MSNVIIEVSLSICIKYPPASQLPSAVSVILLGVDAGGG